ncbi:excinuclease ABC subunit UvrB [Candidatus Berkelbacteria bacterium]|nr:excinuclease ABC subunit UvrB [Candidatus Berkelbacteria bacterium]
MKFKLKAPFTPTGDQPQAIKKLTRGLKKGLKHQTLLGVTGSGKTFTMASVVAQVQKPTLIISHNKTLAAQLYNEFRQFFPSNAVHYFVSYYDYYQPEAYVRETDTYIEKDASINDEIDRLRHAATHSLLTRKDVLIVASVSAIYGLGSPEHYSQITVNLKIEQEYPRTELFRKLSRTGYERNDMDFFRSCFRARGEAVEIFPAWSDFTVRLEFQGQILKKITEIDALTGKAIKPIPKIIIFPATHYLTPENLLKKAAAEIRDDLKKRLKEFKKQGKFLEAERIEQRTNFDLEMIEQTGTCQGIENYSRYFDCRSPGAPPYTLIDYFDKDYLLIIDESHMTIPQINGMYEGDRSRKQNLVDFGFRLPSALDNRPLKFAEFEKRMGQAVYTSATPAKWELARSKQVVEQLIRPTGVVDPEIEVRPTHNQLENLISEIEQRVAKKQRVLVTTLTKRMAEDLTEYLLERNIKVAYLHSDIETLERPLILRDLRLGVYDVVVGINLLREGLDLPEVSLVAILDADKEGFLRSEVALIQTIGRAARHIEGKVIMYADKITQAIKGAIFETSRRRQTQIEYNRKHHITPKTIQKKIIEYIETYKKAEEKALALPAIKVPESEIPRVILELQKQMDLAARNLEFEKAAVLRDKIKELVKN